MGVPPKRSTPSRAAVIIAEPKVEGSKRVGRLDVEREAAVEREGRPVGMCTPEAALLLAAPTMRGVRIGEDCWRLSLPGLARWAWKRSRRWGWSCFLMPFRSRILRKLVSDLSAMWIR
jgi:hypothetical protein